MEITKQNGPTFLPLAFIDSPREATPRQPVTLAAALQCRQPVVRPKCGKLY
jgi:hypothetical protein